MSDSLIAKHGGYRNLKSFQTSVIIYDLTVEFCKLYIDSFKLKDQMEGAARGGSQNIGEGSQTSGTSKQSELRLTDVARASQEELLKDYHDFLRQRGLAVWSKDDQRSLEIRKLSYGTDRTYKTYATYLAAPESAANCLICLIHQANFLLDRQMKTLEKDLLEHGDFKDRLKQIKKQQLVGNDDYDEFLKQFGMRRLENGQVVKIE